MTLLFRIHVPLIHRYIIFLNTVISYICIIATLKLCTQLYHAHTSLLYRFTSIHVLIISVFMLHGSLYILHGYSCILITWLFFITDIDILVTGHECCWYAMCETKCHVNLNHGGHLYNSHSCFSSFIILFHDINRAHVLLAYYMYHALFLFLIHCIA